MLQVYFSHYLGETPAGWPLQECQGYPKILCKNTVNRLHVIILYVIILYHHVIFAEFIGHGHLYKYVVKHKSAKLCIILYAVGKLEAVQAVRASSQS